MTLWSRFRFWLLAVLRRSRMERDMDTELRFHIEARAEDLLSDGVPREKALPVLEPLPAGQRNDKSVWHSRQVETEAAVPRATCVLSFLRKPKCRNEER